MVNLKKQGGGIKFSVIIAIMFGAAIVIGSSFAMTATDKSGFCGSCHSMSESSLTHSKSLHAKLACNECHAPHNIAVKIPFKSKEAMRDVTATMTKNIPDLIHAGGETRDVVQKNCLRCHGAVIEGVSMTAKPYCTDCHRNVPHAPRTPIAKRSAADA
ncbi:MAG: NapC/NirT family cytochrome c [Desulfobacterales bacterium]|nr:NapC/NirT family cytochrome c [Desulfobacterales bacterium]